MGKKKLEELDERLIELLSERISLLAESELASQEKQMLDLQPQLAKFGLPDFVWENVLTSCAAAVVTAASSLVHIQPRQVTVIGGRGMMGQLFTEQLSAGGHKVRILGRGDWEDADRLLAGVDLVLISVPIERTIEVIEKTAQYISPTTIVADLTSIKAPIVQVMLESHVGPVLGLHPMFGPGVKSFLSQKFVVCHGRDKESCQWFLDFIENQGGQLIVCTPEEHDQMMVAVQAIRHFSTFGLGVFLAEESIDITRSLEFSSPIYRLGIDLVSRLFAQDASLYVEIMLATEERCEAIARLGSTFSRLATLVVQKDREALMREFENTRSVFGEETERALRESNHVINSLSTLLAAIAAQQRTHS